MEVDTDLTVGGVLACCDKLMDTADFNAPASFIDSIYMKYRLFRVHHGAVPSSAELCETLIERCLQFADLVDKALSDKQSVLDVLKQVMFSFSVINS